MPSLYRDTGYNLSYLVDEIKHGGIALPDIQRPFVWSAAKVRDLFDSMYRGYPVGTLMLWETGAQAGTRQIGGGSNDRVPRLLVVDGQQRLTSLYAVLTGQPVYTKNFEHRRIRVAFRPRDERFEVADAAIERDPDFISDISVLFAGRLRRTIDNFLRQLSDARGEPLTEDEKELLAQRIDDVEDLGDFRFQVVELGTSADEENVAEIFVRTNSEGVTLNQSDFILTLMSVHWEKGRRQLEEFARSAVDPSITTASPKNAFIDPSPDQLLRAGVGFAFRRGRLRLVYNLLRGKNLETGEYNVERRDAQFERLRDAQDKVLDLTSWHEFLKAVRHAGFLSRRMITSENALIYTYILWLIGRHDYGLPFRTLRGVIGRWFFMAHTTGRYTSSPESQIESDLSRIRDIPLEDGDAFCGELDRIVRANFTNDYWDISLPGRLDTSSPRSPALYAYWAALNLLDAEVLFSTERVRDLSSPEAGVAPRALERHHLFPKKYLSGLGYESTRQTNAIANMAYLDWPDNAEIGAKGPAAYWPDMSSRLAADRLKKQEYWHALPVGWAQLDYQEFLERRRVRIAQVIRDGFQTLWGKGGNDPRPVSLEDLLAAGESQTLEYKSTARWNIRTNQVDKVMEHVIIKSVCGMLNAEGGILLIGVDDSANILGLGDDFQTLGRRGNRDGYELFLRQMIDSGLSLSTAGMLHVRFEEAEGKDVCIVSIAASGRPVFAKAVSGGGGTPTEFWVRIGNATRQLHGDDMVSYQATHW